VAQIAPTHNQKVAMLAQTIRDFCHRRRKAAPPDYDRQHA
jgi:hypothetical protein